MVWGPGPSLAIGASDFDRAGGGGIAQSLSGVVDCPAIAAVG